MFQRFLSHIEKENLIQNEDSLILAISGGIDSMVMLDLFHKSSFKFEVAHFDHETRNGQSTLDAQFVKNICSTKQIPFHIKSFPVASKKGNFQDNARQLRYDFMQSLGKDKIVTAHHKDDGIETILLNFLNGRGYKSIPITNNATVRPLLIFTKNEIWEYATKNNITFVEDATNKTSDYDRNFIRNELLPILSGRFENLENKLINYSNLSLAKEKAFNQLSHLYFEAQKTNDHLKIKLDKIVQDKDSSYWLMNIMKDYNFSLTQCQNIVSSKSSIGKRFLSKSHEAVIDRTHLLIYKKTEKQTSKKFQILNAPQSIAFNDIKLNFEIIDVCKEQKLSSKEILIDQKYKNSNFELNYWSNGDRFIPKGMNGKSQSLKKFFANNKIDRHLKHNIPLLLIDNQIAWIIGYRQDERHIPNNESSKAIKVSLC